MSVHYIDALVQERRNCIANALELRFSCTNPSICAVEYLFELSVILCLSSWFQVHEISFLQFLNSDFPYGVIMKWCLICSTSGAHELISNWCPTTFTHPHVLTWYLHWNHVPFLLQKLPMVGIRYWRPMIRNEPVALIIMPHVSCVFMGV